MTTRRTVLRLAGAVPAAALLTGCRPILESGAAEPTPSAAMPYDADSYDVLSVRLPAGLAQIDGRGGRVRFAPRPGVISADASVLAWAEPVGAGTRLEVRGIIGNDGADFGVAVPGQFTPRVVAPGGGLVALASGGSSGSSPYRPDGRSETTIVIADRGGERRRLTLPGCVEPEAFSTEGERLFVLDYQPPQRPDRYRVRMVELASGAFGPLLTRAKVPVPAGAEEEMRGEGRQAVFAAANQFLFTLYTHQPDHEHTRDLLAARAGKPDVHAFVHSLNTQIGFAYCIDLPAPFGHGPAAAHAIALRQRLEDPFVIDAASGSVAHLDGVELTVRRLGSFPKNPSGGTASAVISPGEPVLFVGTGTAVHCVNTSTLKAVTTWSLPAPVRGIGISADGHRLWVGQPDAVVALDSRSGTQVARVPAPGLVSLNSVSA